uniref:Uncharacterized protein n=1 Tax=Brassica oleracea TaxID=3712 RepID=A0A3P6B388_BRAOL|nr:unnamed protein product [Brassica oleracea]
MADEDFQSRVKRIFEFLAFSRSTSSTTSTSSAPLLRQKRNRARCGLSPAQKWRSGSGSESSSLRTIGKRCLVRHRSTRF